MATKTRIKTAVGEFDVVTHYDSTPALYIAVTTEYDGAPDAGRIAGATGYGKTTEAAIEDLKERLDDEAL